MGCAFETLCGIYVCEILFDVYFIEGSVYEHAFDVLENVEEDILLDVVPFFALCKGIEVHFMGAWVDHGVVNFAFELDFWYFVRKLVTKDDIELEFSLF